MADTPVNSFADGVVADDDILIVQTAAGGGKNPRGNRFVRTDVAGNVGIGTAAPAAKAHVKSVAEAFRIEGTAARGSGSLYLTLFDPTGRKGYLGYGQTTNDDFFISNDLGAIRFLPASVEAGRFDASGNLLVGVTSGAQHTIAKGTGEGNYVLSVGGTDKEAVRFYSGPVSTYSSAAAVLYVNARSGNNRSINAAGTINASGADYAEYMTKAAGCGTIAPGDVCGVDIDGHLTRTWADAISFVVKSTDPSIVGGDTWTASIGEMPADPGPEPTAPTAPGDEPVAPPALADEPSTDDADAHAQWVTAKASYDVAFAAWQAEQAAWQAATTAYPAALASFNEAHAAWQAASTAYATDLPAWEAALEAARQNVDRIAFCGQLPVNVTGDFAVGDYIIAAANGSGIQAIAVPAADITFEQYRLRIGKVWAIRDGRAWIDVQHG